MVLLDTAKGFVPALVATQVVGHGSGVLAGAAAMLGHYRPLFMKFHKGGKMVATTGGAFLGVAPLVGGVGAGVWILVFVVTRYPSLASMVGTASLPLWSWLLGYPWPVTAFSGVRRPRGDRAAPREHRPPLARRGEPVAAVAALVAEAVAGRGR